MARYKHEETIKQVEIVDQTPIINTISLNDYLAKYNRQRVLDKVIRKWYLLIDKTNPKKSVSEWDGIIQKFRNETER